MKRLFPFIIAVICSALLFTCDDDKNQEKDEDNTTFSAYDSLSNDPFFFPSVSPNELRGTVNCGESKNLTLRDSTIMYATYIIYDSCEGGVSRFVETPDGYQEITNYVINKFVATYSRSFTTRVLYCEGEGDGKCTYEINIGENITVPGDTLKADTLSCASRSFIYANNSQGDITVKVIILEKCTTGTLEIIARKRSYTPLTHTYTVNQVPSTTKITLEPGWFLELRAFGSGGKVVYKLVIP